MVFDCKVQDEESGFVGSLFDPLNGSCGGEFEGFIRDEGLKQCAIILATHKAKGGDGA
jgi:hypothetical protein